MTQYTKEDLQRLARRHHNTKRTYLLVNPLQGKHLPVSPTRALEMMAALGSRLAEASPAPDLVIGFAETATAVAAVAAGRLRRDCRYIHTTREAFPPGPDICFKEEHSHAVDQRLCMARLRGWMESASAPALVDDELSTGKTLTNIVAQLKGACPSLEDKPLLAASIINRLTPEREQALARHNIRCLSLLHLPQEDYTDAVRGFDIVGAEPPTGAAVDIQTVMLPPSTGDAREGVLMSDWLGQLETCAAGLVRALSPQLSRRRVTVLGTEEYMLPGLLFGRELERAGIAERVRFHATTRSPIGICDAAGYPIRRGWHLRSFYEAGRDTFIYNLQPCDVAVVMTDSPDDAAAAMGASDLAAALGEVGCAHVILIREARHLRQP